MCFRRINPFKYNNLNAKLHQYYRSQGLQQAYTQNIINILSACEDSRNIAIMKLGGTKQAVAQTGQMALENELMENGEARDAVSVMHQTQDPQIPIAIECLEKLVSWGNPLAVEILETSKQLRLPEMPNLPTGYFADDTSFRDEKVTGDWRHNNAFKLSEFEVWARSKETAIDELAEFNSKLLIHLGFDEPKIVKYEDECERLGVQFIDDDEETAICEKYGPTLLGWFPKRSDPYWNMLQLPDGTAAKFDVLLPAYNPVSKKAIGLECAGTAVRSCNNEEMSEAFEKQDDGKYAQRLRDEFGTYKVNTEKKRFLQNNFVPRFGGGVGFERVLAAMEYKGLI